MLERMKYVNHMNEVIDFGKNGIFVNENDLHDYSWDITSRNNKISDFSKGIVTKTIPVIVCCNNHQEWMAIRDKLSDITEKDVISRKYGKVVIGDYYLQCYVTASKKADYLKNKGYMKATLTIKTDKASWIKESTSVFSNNQISSEYLDYPYDYAYDYLSTLSTGILNNTEVSAAHFRMVIYGFATNPVVYINGHEYNVETDISTGEYLTIDTVQKTIILTRYNGEKVNCFNKRNRDSYIFEKIPPGNNVVSCEGSLHFEITLIGERSEPRWI